MYHFMEFSLWHELPFKGNVYVILFTVLLLKSTSLNNIPCFSCFWILWIESFRMLSLESGLFLLKIVKWSFICIVVDDLARGLLRLCIIRLRTVMYPFSVDGHVNVFMIWLLWKMLLWTFPNLYLVTCTPEVLNGIDPWVDWRDHEVCIS